MIRNMVLAIFLLALSQAVSAQAEPYQEGVHYFKIDQAPASNDSGKVEVTELFSYGCSHCNTFEPYMQSWLKSKPEHVELNRIAVGFGRKEWEMMARAYIAAEMLGIVEESHVAMMDAIWKERKQFRNPNDLAKFYSQFDVTEEAFLAHFNSFAADSQLRRSQNDVRVFGITGTPSMVVARKYRISSNKNVNGFNAMLDVVNYLVEKEAAALNIAEAP